MSNLPPGAGDGTSSGRSTKRTVFRVLGVLLMGTALVLIGIAAGDFFAAFGSDDFGAEPTRFWMFFAALPFFALGGLFLQLGFVGAAAKYVVGEAAPALKTSMDQLGVGRYPSASTGSGPFCRSCGRQNDADARFCDSCGTSMSV